jgi:outer membrane protein insertion porin family
MHIRALGKRTLRHIACATFTALLICGLFGFIATRPARAQETAPTPAGQQPLVEDIQIRGNRRLRQEDLLTNIKTQKGEPYNKEQAERDLQTLLGLGFFAKVPARVYTQPGANGGVVVIFELEEQPIIRDIQYEGLKSITDADILKAFREQRIGVSKEATFDPVKVNNSVRVIKELLAARGYPNATVNWEREPVSRTSVILKYNINEGERVRVVEIQFTGNQVFSQKQLRNSMKYVKETGIVSRFTSKDILDPEKLEADLQGNVRNFMRARGYLQASVGEPRVEGLGEKRTGVPVLKDIPLPVIGGALGSTDEALRIIVPVNEGKLYRVGEIKIEGNSVISEQRIRAVIGLNKGDVASGERISKGLFEDLKRLYGSAGFIEYEADPEPTFHDNPANPKEGIADFTIRIDEGKQFTLRRLDFLGNTFTRDYVMRREVLLNEGDIYNQALLEYSVQRLNQLGYFDPIDKDKDVERRTNDEQALVDLNIKVTERGRQQISFNGGVSGIGGSFIGFEYSTNNLLGRGESLALNIAIGNLQRSAVFSFTEPYVRNRPITAGFSIFTQSYQFFGQGTLLSQNTAAQQAFLATSGLLGATNLAVSSENLFTQKTTGGSIFASSPLSEFYKKRRFTEFSRFGLSYTLSQTSIKDPTVNTQNNPETFIPVVYHQPNIITSQITPTFVYDTRNAAIDPTQGTQISFGLAFAGLGGDVRTYEPTISYIHFMPVRNKKSPKPQVFGFRLLAGYVSSYAVTDKVIAAEASSLSYINGVPIFNRFFLGDEFTIRGYNVRSITPIAPVDFYVTSRNVVIATNASGTPTAIPTCSASVTTACLPASLVQSITALGTFTGVSGSNVAPLGRSFTATGGDAQVLGNFEYRIPIFGPVSAAAFVDIGSSFNLKKPGDQIYSSEFLQDVPFLSQTLINLRGASTAATLNALVAQNNPRLAFVNNVFSAANGALLLRDGRLASQEELNNAQGSAINPVTGLPIGFDPFFLRGEAQTNTAVRLSQSIFSGFLNNLRSSVGAELRVQLPVVNVPIRLIYAYNPNARTGIISDIPGVQFNLGEQRNVFRFSIGRTF